MPVKRRELDDDANIIKVNPDEILVCDQCNLPITDRQNGMDIALMDLYFMNWGIVDKMCYDQGFRSSIERDLNTRLKLYKVFKKGEDVSEVRNHGTLQVNTFCPNCETMNIIDTVIDRRDKLPDKFTCYVCGFTIEKPFEEDR